MSDAAPAPRRPSLMFWRYAVAFVIGGALMALGAVSLLPGEVGITALSPCAARDAGGCGDAAPVGPAAWAIIAIAGLALVVCVVQLWRTWQREKSA